MASKLKDINELVMSNQDAIIEQVNLMATEDDKFTQQEADTVWNYSDGLPQKRIFNMMMGKGSPDDIANFDVTRESERIEQDYTIIKSVIDRLEK